jgi:hypothetical protein
MVAHIPARQPGPLATGGQRQSHADRQLDPSGVGATLQPGRLAAQALPQPVPVLESQVVRLPIQTGANLDPPSVVPRSDAHPQGTQVAVRKAGEAFEDQAGLAAARAAPGQVPPQAARFQVEAADKSEQLALVEAEALAGEDDLQLQPIGCISQLGEEDRHVVENPVQERGAHLAGMGLLEGAARSQVAVAKGEDGFPVMHLFRVEVCLGQRPDVGLNCHAVDSPKKCN